MPTINPDDFIISRKRKLYKFAVFQNLANCYDDHSLKQLVGKIQNDKRPLTIEVGAGSALFLTKLAANHPNRQFVAIDRKSDRLQKGAQLASQQNISNIYYLWSNADKLDTIFSPHSVQQIWLTFPDPWPQESNIKHRLTNPRFLASYAKLLDPSGTLNFKTDNQALFNWSLEQLHTSNWRVTVSTNQLHNPATQKSPINKDAYIMTTYEERYHKAGNSIYYLSATAPDNYSAD